MRMRNDEGYADHESDSSECKGDINAPALPHFNSPDRVSLSGNELKLSIDANTRS